MTMTLVETIIRNLEGRKGFDAAFDINDDVLAEIKQEMADAIDAHLAQPAQSVDVEKVREVIAKLNIELGESDRFSRIRVSTVRFYLKKLTAALQEKGMKVATIFKDGSYLIESEGDAYYHSQDSDWLCQIKGSEFADDPAALQERGNG